MRHLFTFAVMTDSHIKLEKGDESSPYQANRLANSRSRYVVKLLNSLKPQFVVHLGDFVQPVPSLPAYEPAMELAKEIFADLEAPLHGIPGNHDIGDKPLAWMPGPKVDEAGVQKYAKFWGQSFHSFDSEDIHFVMINSPILNSGAPTELEQQKWLEQDLASAHGKRIFLFTHYPLYIYEPEEEENYDNLGEPARSWLLSLIRKHQIEAVFAGHVHHFFYTPYEGTDQYVLPSVTFVRHDYSEFFNVEPGAETEGGRNDTDKMGIFLVHVYSDGHRFELIRTHGKIETEEAPSRLWSGTASRSEHAGERLGVYLRHAWAERVVLPYANLDEFDRKVMRNDYPLLALHDLGIRKLRIPIRDLRDPDTRKRVELMHSKGYRFTVFTSGVPTQAVIETMGSSRSIIDVWELVWSPEELDIGLPLLAEFKRHTPIKFSVSLLETSAGARGGEASKSRYYHFIRHGFRASDQEIVDALLALPQAHETIDQLVFRIGPEDDFLKVGGLVTEMAARHGFRAALHIQMQGSDNPAAAHRDDIAIAGKIALVAAFMSITPTVDVFLDTFIDHDRGYYIRNGLLDRRHNPRPAYSVLKHLNLWFAAEEGGTVLEFSSSLSQEGISVYRLHSSNPIYLLIPASAETLIDFNRWTESELDWTGDRSLIDLTVGTAVPLASIKKGLWRLRGPMLIT